VSRNQIYIATSQKQDFSWEESSQAESVRDTVYLAVSSYLLYYIGSCAYMSGIEHPAILLALLLQPSIVRT
jgi:hypothetical protein